MARLYKMGTPIERIPPKKAAREYAGVTRLMPATLVSPNTRPAITESDSNKIGTTIM